jgi:Tfp pilus assembly protein PilV
MSDVSPLTSDHRPLTSRCIPSALSACSAVNRRGMTLIESALATIIIGVGVLSIVYAQQVFHNQNHWATHAATGARLANEMREMMLNLPRHDPVNGNAYWGPEPNETTVQDYNDLDDFDGAIFSAINGSGPINARREVIPNMPGWTQIIQVDMVDANDINFYHPIPNDPDDYPENYLMRVTVIVTHQRPSDDEAVEITRVSWVSPY